jgi:hypothetical protein
MLHALTSSFRFALLILLASAGSEMRLRVETPTSLRGIVLDLSDLV